MEVCCYKKCSDSSLLDENEDRVEVKTIFPKSSRQIDRKNFIVNWYKNGEAKFHRDCWEAIDIASRSRSKKPDVTVMVSQEKTLVKEANKTAEHFDSRRTIKDQAKRVADMLKCSKHCVAFTGAGISTSAGIGDYRGKSGKWTEMDQEQINVDSIFEDSCEPETKKQKRDVQEQEQEESRDDQEEEDGVPYESLRPTYTHEALVKLIEMDLIKYIVSQNGDGLHTLSGIPHSKISELHGNVFQEKCEKCKTIYDRKFYVMDDIGSQFYEEIEDFGKTDVKKPSYAIKCKKCGLSHRTGRKCEKKGCKGFLKDTIINFRDLLEEVILDNAKDNSTMCDLMLCLGTTITVTPASDLVGMGKKPLKLVICNRQETHMDSKCTAKKSKGQLGSRVFGDCDIFFQEIMKNLLEADALKEWEENRAERMKVYDKKRDAV